MILDSFRKTRQEANRGYLVVGRIEDDGDRVLFFPFPFSHYHDRQFYVVASPEQAKGIQIWDRIEYGSHDPTFGTFTRKVAKWVE